MQAHRFTISITLTLASALACPSASAQAVGPFSSAPEVTRLPNGLRVITVPWESPGIVAYFTLVRVGARDEVEPGHSGFAHLFEHMMFRGTERFPQDVYEARVQELGADNNAYTTQDFTLYTVTLPASALPQIVELEADRFQRLSYDEQQFRTETGAVLGEYNKSSASPFLKMWEALSELAFEEHTYGHTTIGYLTDIRAMPDKMAYSQAFFRRFYTPDNTSIIVAGDVAHDELVKLVSGHYGAWTGTRDQPQIPVEPEPSEGERRHLAWEGTTTPRMLIGYRTPGFESEESRAQDSSGLLDTAALEVVHGLLFERSSPLYQDLVVEQRELLALSSWAHNWSRDPGLFVVDAELTARASFDDVERRIQAALEEVAASKVSAERIDAVRSHLRYGLIMQVETASDAADLLAQFVAVSGEVDGLARYLTALKNVTAADVARVAQRYLIPTRRFTVTLAPKKEAGGKP